jgi:hypothetical protein
VRLPRLAVGAIAVCILVVAAPLGAQQLKIVQIDNLQLPTTPIQLDTLWAVGRNTMHGVDSVFQVISSIGLDSTGPSPRLLVLDFRDAVLRAFDMNGKFLMKVGRQGEGPSEFRIPTALSVAPDGHIFVYDPGLGRLTEFSNDLEFIRTLAPKAALGPALSMIVLKDDIVMASVVLSGPGAGRVIHVLDRETGAHRRSFGAPPPAPSDRVARLIGAGRVRLGRDGSLWYAYVAPYIIENYGLDGKLRFRIERPTKWLPPAGDAYEITLSSSRARITNQEYAQSAGVIELPDGRVLHQTFLTDGRDVLDWYDSAGHLVDSRIGRIPILNISLGNGRYVAVGGGKDETAWFGIVQVNP